MKLKKYILTLSLFTFIISNAQKGSIRGTVFEDATGESLPGVTIMVEGTSSGTFTDLDGKFNISLNPGKYAIKVSYISYDPLIIGDLEVTPGNIVLLDNLRLKESSVEITEVVVTAQKVRNTEAALLTMKRISPNVIDGISASNFRKIGDSDAASSMKRVTGVSVTGGKYVFVRGLGDRYTKTTLNGVDIPGLDPDRNSLQMDIFPTNVIDNIIVLKSFSAELPADFTGGIIDINIKDFPEERKGNLSISGGYNPGAHFNNDYLTYEGGNKDYLGFDDGSRDIPAKENVPLFTSVIGNPNGTDGLRFQEILKSFNPTMAAIKEKSFMDYSAGFSFGDQAPLEKFTIGYNTAVSYRSSTDFYKNAEFGRFRLSGDPNVYEMDMLDNQKGNYGTSNILLSGLVGVAVKTKSSKIRLNFLHLQNGESKAGIFDYLSNDRGSVFSGFQHNLDYSERALSNVILEGKHTINDSKWEIVWKTSPTLSKLYDPDIRFTRYVGENLNIIGTESGFPERIWRELEETNFANLLHVTREFKFRDEKAKIKFGANYTIKDRDYIIYTYAINIRGNVGLTGDPNEIFKPENLWPFNGNSGAGTTYEASFIPDNPNQYQSSIDSKAAYISADVSPFKNFKSIIGVRYEAFKQLYTGQNQLGTKVLDNDEVLNKKDFFPSVNLIYNLTEKQNLRFSFTKTIARPSFKELSYAEIYDPISGRTFIGGLYEDRDDANGIVYWDGKLKSTDILNFDIRWELFQEAGQTVSLSGFYKSFTNPIEMVQYASQEGSFQPRNVGDGNVFGAEIELRENLTPISNALEKITLSANFTFTQSSIEMSETEYSSKIDKKRTGQSIDKYRNMAGQAPYIINAGLSYNGAEEGFWNQFEAGFYYNVQGSTLQYVGIADLPDIYSQPFHTLNFNANKTFLNGIQLGFKVDNILNDKNEYVFKAFKADNQIYSLLEPGVSYQLRVSYTF